MDAVREKLIAIEKRYNELSAELMKEDVLMNPSLLKKLWGKNRL